jgi:hypothetical protein
VGFNVLEVATAEAEPGLDEIPEPAPSVETANEDSAPIEPAFRTRVRGKGLCGLCMGAFPESVLSVIDGKPYCPDCSPVVGSRREPEVDLPSAPDAPEPHPELVSGPLFQEQRSGGGTKGVLAVFVLALLAGVGVAVFLMMDGDRIDEMMSGLDSGRKDAYLLAQTYVPGETMHYGITGNARATGEVSGAFGQSGDLGLAFELDGDLSVNVLKVDRENNAHLAVTIGAFDMDMDLTVDGTPFPLGNELAGPLRELKDETTVLKVDPFGNPIGQATGNDMQQMLNGGFGEIPSRYLKVGDTWTARIPLGAPGTMPVGGPDLSILAFPVKYRVEGFKRLQDRDCMVISLTGDLQGAENLRMPFFDDLKCEMTLKGVMFYDVTIGRLVRMAMDIGVDFGMASPMGGGEFDLEFELDVDLK